MLHYRCWGFWVFLLMYDCNTIEPSLKPNNPILELQGLGAVDSIKVLNLKKEIAVLYPHTIIKKTVEIPQNAFYPARNRYSADSILQFLSATTNNGHICIGITSMDICTRNKDIADWGVMGLGYCPGKSCVVSSYRLSKQNANNQLFKIAVHELGHTFGLKHCMDKTCFMRDAEGHNPTNDEKGFCNSCKNYLKNKGWAFK